MAELEHVKVWSGRPEPAVDVRAASNAAAAAGNAAPAAAAAPQASPASLSRATPAAVRGSVATRPSHWSYAKNASAPSRAPASGG